MSLPVIRQYLRSVGAAEVERLAVALLPELAAPVAAAAPSAGASGAAAVAAVATMEVNDRAEAISDTWHRLTILPGLEVHLHSTASGEVKALARSVVERLRRGP
jgi:hypothetical protein